MIRDNNRLRKENFDAIIIGGGIHGANAAWQCAAQGLRVALVERGDFGGGTSANSLKIIHGGFRYLQHLNFKRMRESIVSRRIMMRVSPENIQPLRCTVPTYGNGVRSKLSMRTALLLNDLISLDRNVGLDNRKHIPGGRVISPGECERAYPGIDWSSSTGGAQWNDAVALNSERLTLAFVHEACRNGAAVSNYLETKEILTHGDTFAGVVVHDHVSGETFEISGKAGILAGGPHNAKLLGIRQDRRRMPEGWAKAVNIIVRKSLVKDAAIGLEGEAGYVDRDAVIKKKGRFFFFVPWRGYTMIGTSYSCQRLGAEPSIDRADIEELLQEINGLLLEEKLAVEDVTNVHVGLVPAYGAAGNDDSVQLIKETEVIDLGEKFNHPLKGVYAITSVKYTTAPLVANKVVKKVCRYLQRPFAKGRLGRTDSQEIEARDVLQPLPPSTREILVERYGSLAAEVGRYVIGGDDVIAESPRLFAGEIDYFVQEEMAQTLQDVVFRRTGLGTADRPDPVVLRNIAGRMADKLGWDSSRVQGEIEEVERKYSWK